MKDIQHSENDPDQIYLGQAPFSVMARIALQLGRESISNSIIAISELVKNAYDADAEKVSIRFANLDTGDPMLVIEDDGNGMTRKQLEEQWLVIGTTDKLRNDHSKQKGRILTGEKGLGRLGLDRLCSTTAVQTFVENEVRGTLLTIDWTKYEILDEKLERIQHDLFSIPKLGSDPITKRQKEIIRGTQLTLSNLKDKWSRDSLKSLRDELRLLVSPFTGIGDFSIYLDSGMNWSDIDGEITSEILLEAAEWNLEAEILQDGSVKFVMWSNQHAETFDFGPTPWNKVFPTSPYELPQCGSLRFEMYFIPRREVNLDKLQFSRNSVDAFMEANQGIRIYRDNFRVKPFGSPDGTGDWLLLSYRRQSDPAGVTQKPIGRWKVGYNQVIGAVFISKKDNPNLIDQTNRENLVEGPAFFEMKMFGEKAIRFFEINRQTFEIERKEQNNSNLDKIKEQVEQSFRSTEDRVSEAKSIVADLIQKIELGDTPPPSQILKLSETLTQTQGQLKENQKVLEKLEKQSEEQRSYLQRQKDTLGNLASLGILATSFGHETLGASNLVLTNARDLQYDMNRGLFMVTPDVQSDIQEELNIIVHESDKIETFAKFMLRNIRRDKRHRQTVNLKEIIERIFASLGKFLREKNIQVSLDISDPFPAILAFEIDWESIFVNLISNSVWALEVKTLKEKQIRVKAFEGQGDIHIKFADSGIGLEAGTKEQIFLPTISTKRNSEGEVIGTGMGLAIVRDFVESHERGSISVESPCDLGGAQFHIQIAIPDISSRGKKTNGY